RLIGDDHGKDDEPGHDHNALDEVGYGDGPHASGASVQGDHRSAEYNALPQREARNDIQDQPQRYELTSGIPKIRRHHKHTGDELCPPAEPGPEEIAERKQVHGIELSREKCTEQKQTQRGAKRVFDYRKEATVKEFGRGAEDRLGAEPRGEQSRGAEEKRQATARQEEVARARNAPCSPYA